MRLLLLSTLLAATALPAPAEEPAATAWPRATPAEAGLDAAPLKKMEASVRAGDFKRIGSVAIARHGKLVYEAYFDGDAATLRDTRSATKSLTGALVGLAVAAGKLHAADATVLGLLPERKKKLANPDPRKLRMTVEDLLTMSNPLECDDWNDASRGNEERMYLVEDWTQFILDLPLRGRMHLDEVAEPPAYGRHFSYCTGGVFILGEIIGKVTGVRLDRWAQAKLFAPLGIARVQWIFSPLGTPQGGGGLRLTTTDILRVAQLYLDGGRWQGKPVLDPGWVRTSLQAHARIDEQTEYGYLWWLKSFGTGERKVATFFMSGNGGNKVMGIPALDATVAITSTNYNTRGMHEQTEKLLVDYILPSLR
jgi:CubicO group peptidase (beta-lactamase class C family)